MFQASEIQRLIEQGLPCEFVAIEGDDGVHFSGIVVSAAFEGKPRVRQHQVVYATLGSLLGNEIHALQLQTYASLAEWVGRQVSDTERYLATIFCYEVGNCIHDSFVKLTSDDGENLSGIISSRKFVDKSFEDRYQMVLHALNTRPGSHQSFVLNVKFMTPHEWAASNGRPNIPLRDESEVDDD